MILSNLDVFLTLGNLETLLYYNLKQDRFVIQNIKSSGVDIIVNGKASVVGNWSATFEPMRSDDGRCLVFHVKSFELKGGFARLGFWIFKNCCKGDLSHDSEEFLVKTVAEKMSSKGAWADGKHLLVDITTVVSSVVKIWKSNIQVGKITCFRSTGDGLRLTIESA